MAKALNNFVSEYAWFFIFFGFFTGVLSVLSFLGITRKNGMPPNTSTTNVFIFQGQQQVNNPSFLDHVFDFLFSDENIFFTLGALGIIGLAAKITYLAETVLILLSLLLCCIFYISYTIRKVTCSNSGGTKSYVIYICTMLICILSVIMFVFPLYKENSIRLTQIKEIDRIFYYIYLGIGLILSILSPILSTRDYSSSLKSSINNTRKLLVDLLLAIIAISLTSGILLHVIEAISIRTLSSK